MFFFELYILDVIKCIERTKEVKHARGELDFVFGFRLADDVVRPRVSPCGKSSWRRVKRKDPSTIKRSSTFSDIISRSDKGSDER